jgi:hypothetical protein
MTISPSGSTLRARAFSLLLSYTLFISLCAPFIIVKAEAATPASNAASTVVRTAKVTTET